ncbi:NADH:flavin oxidoreductase [uncultured Marinococcus sp.]|uniref:NADH:flavin oxidoreductase n=1 Tax=uncultured Marinococcus sp. TaxID=487012 RepID=UPI0026245983|nr:NADH:flavin oxidoreductase [uncultured Marinococcus sp.]
MTQAEETLFNQQHISNHIFKNKLIVAPMTRISADDDGTPNDRMRRYYERYALGGFSAVISEGIYTDEIYSQGYANQPGLANEKHQEGWEPITKAVKEHGSKMIAQLMHAGAQSQYNQYTSETASASSVQPPAEKVSSYGGQGAFPVPKAMNDDDMETAKQGFIQAALHALEAGFDGVELHGANGYLLDQFLSASTNKRTDQYGGPAENRVRFLTEVIEAVREAIGRVPILGIRISQAKVTDGSYRWPGGEADAAVIFSELGKTPLDYIHTTDGDGLGEGFGNDTLSMAQAAKEYSGLSVIANGDLGDTGKSSYAINEGAADFVSLGRTALANPDAPHRILRGHPMNSFDPSLIMQPLANVKDAELEQNIFKE